MLFPELTEILDPEAHEASLNMAIDEVLLRGARGPLLRIYRWERPAVSFGFFGKYADVQHAWPQRPLVRRWTGGGIVLHGEDLTYTLAVPRTDSFFQLPQRESYRTVHERIALLLREHGCDVQLAPRAESKISEACFENAAQSDLLAWGRKVAGAAQRRTRFGLLHQGSIQVPQLPADFAARLAEALAARIARRQLTAEELANGRDLALAKYSTEAWNRRF